MGETLYPAKIGRGHVIHLAYGAGMTLCGLNTGRVFHKVVRFAEGTPVTCSRCLPRPEGEKPMPDDMLNEASQ